MVSKTRKVTRTRKRRSKSVNFWARLAKQEPNNAEMQLFGIMTYLQLPYRYTGNAQFILNGKAPDFVHSQNKLKIIELFGERWHRPEEEPQRIEEFARSGYQVLVIWQKELKARNRKNLYIKLKEFEDLPELKWYRSI